MNDGKTTPTSPGKLTASPSEETRVDGHVKSNAPKKQICKSLFFIERLARAAGLGGS